jgi:hypothetical protein
MQSEEEIGSLRGGLKGYGGGTERRLKRASDLHPKWYELHTHTNRDNLTKQALQVLN